MADSQSQATQPIRYPARAFYVIFTEGAERMSFYGLTAILTQHMVANLAFSEGNAAALFSIFSAVTYIAPLFGGFLADRFLGRYRTILYVSFGYVLGHLVLSLWETRAGLYVGCALIALGAGGIKPNVSVFMGDQFKPEQQSLLERAYGWFYFSINVGSTIGITLVSSVFKGGNVSLAFLIPGVAMALALAIYFMGRNDYTKLPPTGPVQNGFFAVLSFILFGAKPNGVPAMKAAEQQFPLESVNGVRAVFRIGSVFLFTSVFWAVFFQYGGSWQIQAGRLDQGIFAWAGAGFFSNYNTVFVLSLIPLMNRWYESSAKKGRPVAPLRKMTIGMFIAPLAFLAAFVLQWAFDESVKTGLPPPNALWQGPQYFFLSLAEVLISITGLEFAYTQAPKNMRGVIMGVWFLCISLGAQLSALVTKVFTMTMGEPIQWQLFFLAFAGIGVVAAIAFALLARWYRPVVPASS